MLIEFSSFKWNLLILLIFPIFTRLKSYTKKIYITKDNNIFKAFRYFFSYILTGIFLIISKWKNRHIKSTTIENISKDKNVIDISIDKEVVSIVETLGEKNEKKHKIKIILFLVGLSAIAMFCYLYNSYLDKDEYKYAKPSVKIFFNIIDLTILSYFIINQKLYKHHFISLGVFTVSLIVIFIISFPFMSEIWQSFLYLFFYSLFFCLYDVLKKKYMDVFYKSPYYMMFFVGLINSILLLIYEIFAYNIDSDKSGIVIGFKKDIKSSGDFFMFILDSILQCICYLGLWLVIYYFTPSHCLISENISEYVNYITNIIDSDDEFYSAENSIIYSICNLFNFVGFLVFTEVIILNFCGLDFNTQKKILLREKIDSVELLNKANTTDSENEEFISE